MWTTEVHDVWGTGSVVTGGASSTGVPASFGFVVAVGRDGSVVRGVVVRGRDAVGVGACPDPPLAARVVGGAGAGALVVGAGAVVCAAVGTGAWVGAGAWVVTGAGYGAGAAGAAG